MPDIDDLIRNLRQFRTTVVRDIPRQLGQEMLEQTHESFKEERFAGSPGGKWPDRTAFGGESNIRYPKLDYNGFLKKSFKWISRRIGRNDADIFVGTDVPFARAHNEGGMPPHHTAYRSAKRGDVHRGRWKYDGPVKKRQFLGVGSVTKARFDRLLDAFLPNTDAICKVNLYLSAVDSH